ncbi:hypothetical protein [Ferruginibacter sp. SUN106]|uniref:hypothetical protein n=1 Tax=Ferruginibacter sp. SUN106 TaxID=2978348 RepID=UPI003D36981D
MNKSVIKNHNTKTTPTGKRKTAGKLRVSFKAITGKKDTPGIVRVLHYQYQESDLQQFVF